jgi:hypothetical protein
MVSYGGERQIGSIWLDPPLWDGCGRSRQTCELIAISLTIDAGLGNDMDSLTREERLALSYESSHMFYLVLCIGRDGDGTAYRRGVGRIEKQAWDADAVQGKIELLWR